MTTIAYDGKILAADGQRTWGSEVRGLNEKKLLIKGAHIYAFSGTAALFPVMVEWHARGADPKNLPFGWDLDKENGGWCLVVVDEDGLAKFTSSCPYIERFDPPIAFGAGQDYAIGAMLAGADARLAVELVSGLCTHTGGEIQVINVAEALALNQVREAAE